MIPNIPSNLSHSKVLWFVFQKPDVRLSRGSIEREDGGLQGPVSICWILSSPGPFSSIMVERAVFYYRRWFKVFAKCFHCYYMALQLSKKLSFCGNRRTVADFGHAALGWIWDLFLFLSPLKQYCSVSANMLQLFLNVPVMYGLAFYLKVLFETSVNRKRG